MKTPADVRRWKEEQLLQHDNWRPEARALILEALGCKSLSYAGYAEVVAVGCEYAEATSDSEFAEKLKKNALEALGGFVMIIMGKGKTYLSDGDICAILDLLIRCCKRARLAALRCEEIKEEGKVVGALANAVGAAEEKSLEAGAALCTEMSIAQYRETEIKRLAAELQAGEG